MPFLHLARAESLYAPGGGSWRINELVSVVLPTYDYGRYLAGALTSVLRQTYAHLEVLVIDDGSTGDTPAVVPPFLTDPRVRYHRRANQGPAAARNFGIAQAGGTWVAFLDADDLWLLAKLARQAVCLAADPALARLC
jgi:glycosyltransferase involved in cell wall biosynthesis